MNIEEHGRYQGYTGARMYRVQNLVRGTVDVAAPSPVAAIITAATLWNEVWQNPEFFSECKCSRLAYSGGELQDE